MDVHIWGVRGSAPAPGPDTIRYGGNTPCISVSLDDSHTLLLDAGTGLAAFGRSVPHARPHTYFLLLSHPQWDHIQGLPMFAPLMDASARIVLLPGNDPDVAGHVLGQMDGVHFPVTTDDIKADISVIPGPISPHLESFGMTVATMESQHPGQCHAFRLGRPQGDLVYMTDNELSAGELSREVVSFCHDARYLIHDAQYIEQERESRTGWGHSFMVDVCRLATAARVRTLIPFHHDPGRSDDALDAMSDRAQRLVPEGTTVLMAREGLHLPL